MKKLNCFVVDENPFVLDSVCSSLLNLGLEAFPFRSCNMIHQLLSCVGSDLIVCKPTKISEGMVSLVHSIRDNYPDIYLLAIYKKTVGKCDSVIFDQVIDPQYSLRNLSSVLRMRFPEVTAIAKDYSETKATLHSPIFLDAFFRSIRTLLPVMDLSIEKRNVDLLTEIALSIMDLTHRQFSEVIYNHFSKFLELLDVGGLIESTHAEYLTVIKWEIDKLERQQKANSIHPFLQQFDI